MPIRLLDYAAPEWLWLTLMDFDRLGGVSQQLSYQRNQALKLAYKRWTQTPAAGKVALEVFRNIGASQADVEAMLGSDFLNFARGRYATNLLMRNKQAPALPSLPPNMVNKTFAYKPRRGVTRNAANKTARFAKRKRGQ